MTFTAMDDLENDLFKGIDILKLIVLNAAINEVL